MLLLIFPTVLFPSWQHYFSISIRRNLGAAWPSHLEIALSNFIPPGGRSFHLTSVLLFLRKARFSDNLLLKQWFPFFFFSTLMTVAGLVGGEVGTGLVHVR